MMLALLGIMMKRVMKLRRDAEREHEQEQQQCAYRAGPQKAGAGPKRCSDDAHDFF